MDCLFRNKSIFLLLSILTTLYAHAQRDNRKDWIRMGLYLQISEMKLCGNINEDGKNWGKVAYERVAPNCANLFVNGSYLARSLDSLDIYLSKPEAGSNRACYNAGWYMGYLQAHQLLWEKCESQLDKERQIALQKRIEKCRNIANIVLSDSISLGNFLIDNSTGDAKLEAEKLRKKMFILVSIGQSEAAWQQLLETERSEDFSTLPCQATLGLVLAGDL